MSEWQPIETAPKDGSHILLYVSGFIVVARWRWESGQFPWRIVGSEDCWNSNLATYWQPLPLPPEESEE